MPFRDDLLLPISDVAPAGVDLAYDKLFDQIKEARTEDDDSLPTGTWSRALKKADRPLVLRLAGEALATRSKDLRLAGWYGESLLRHEGFSELTPLLALLRELQETFWEGLFPLRDDDGDLGRRVGALESAAAQLAVQLRLLPLTRSGITYLQARDARALGYEKDATTQDKKDLRSDAVARGRVLPEDFDAAIAETPKSFYAEIDAALGQGTEALDALDAFHADRYGDDPPSFVRLKSAMEDVGRFAAGILAEKRRLDPDPQPVPENVEPAVEMSDPLVKSDDGAPETTRSEVEGLEGVEASLPRGGLGPARSEAAPLPSTPGTEPESRPAALAQVAGAVRFLSRDSASPETAYALAAAPAIALLFRVERDHAWQPPAAGVRASLRRLAREGNWASLERAGLESMAAQPETLWLDLHRYLWQAAEELGHGALAAVVVATVRGCLQQLPDLPKALLEDDTPMASMETQSWLRALQPERLGNPTAAPEPPIAGFLANSAHPGFGFSKRDRKQGSEATEEAFPQALALLKNGRVPEAIGLLSRDAEEQPSGRLRFERRLQLAEVCLQAGHPKVAQPLLADLMAELERRALDGWESASLLGKPLALTIRCLDGGVSSSENRDTLFARLCRLDPVAAAGLDRREGGEAG